MNSLVVGIFSDTALQYSRNLSRYSIRDISADPVASHAPRNG